MLWFLNFYGRKYNRRLGLYFWLLDIFRLFFLCFLYFILLLVDNLFLCFFWCLVFHFLTFNFLLRLNLLFLLSLLYRLLLFTLLLLLLVTHHLLDRIHVNLLLTSFLRYRAWSWGFLRLFNLIILLFWLLGRHLSVI